MKHRRNGIPLLRIKRACPVQGSCWTEDNDLNAEIAVESAAGRGLHGRPRQRRRGMCDMLEKAANGTYQLILMDIQMPVMNGYDAAKRYGGWMIPQSEYPHHRHDGKCLFRR